MRASGGACEGICRRLGCVHGGVCHDHRAVRALSCVHGGVPPPSLLRVHPDASSVHMYRATDSKHNARGHASLHSELLADAWGTSDPSKASELVGLICMCGFCTSPLCWCLSSARAVSILCTGLFHLHVRFLLVPLGPGFPWPSKLWVSMQTCSLSPTNWLPSLASAVNTGATTG